MEEEKKETEETLEDRIRAFEKEQIEKGAEIPIVFQIAFDAILKK